MEMKFSVVSAEIGERKHEDGRDFNPQVYYILPLVCTEKVRSFEIVFSRNL